MVDGWSVRWTDGLMDVMKAFAQAWKKISQHNNLKWRKWKRLSYISPSDPATDQIWTHWCSYWQPSMLTLPWCYWSPLHSCSVSQNIIVNKQKIRTKVFPTSGTISSSNKSWNTLAHTDGIFSEFVVLCCSLVSHTSYSTKLMEEQRFCQKLATYSLKTCHTNASPW